MRCLADRVERQTRVAGGGLAGPDRRVMAEPFDQRGCAARRGGPPYLGVGIGRQRRPLARRQDLPCTHRAPARRRIVVRSQRGRERRRQVGRVEQSRSYGSVRVIQQAGAYGVRQRCDHRTRAVPLGPVCESCPHRGRGGVGKPDPLRGFRAGAHGDVGPDVRVRVGQDHRDGPLGKSAPLQGGTGRSVTAAVEGEQAQQQRCRQRRVASDSVRRGRVERGHDPPACLCRSACAPAQILPPPAVPLKNVRLTGREPGVPVDGKERSGCPTALAIRPGRCRRTVTPVSRAPGEGPRQV